MRYVPCLLTLGLLAPLSRAQALLDCPLSVITSVNSGEEVRLAGDADGDGDLDLFRFDALGFELHGFRVLLNDGTGQFTDGPTTPFATDSYYYGAMPRFGDVNGDSIGDVIVADGGGHSIRVFLGLGGAHYGAEIAIAVPAQPLAIAPLDIALGDANADGTLEIAEVHYEGVDSVIRWWSWNGSAFASSSGLHMTFPALVYQLAAIDLDGDGVDDLVGGLSSQDGVVLLPTVAGAATQGATVPVPLSSAQSLYGRIPFAGDIDGDGDVDLVVFGGKTFTEEIAVFDNLGAGSFAVGAPQVLPTATFETIPRRFLADWDGDGDLDLFASGGNGARVYRNDGGAHYTSAASLTMGYSASGAGPGDYDADGFTDYCAAQSLRFGNGLFQSTLAITGSNIPETPRDVLADWEGDGDVDVIAPGRLLINDGSGTLSLKFAMPTAPFGLGYTNVFATGDFSGDGRLDWLAGFGQELFPFNVVLFAETHLIADDGVGGYVDRGAAAAPGVALSEAPPGTVAPLPTPAVDIDLDGDIDLVLTGGYWPNAGNGFFPGFQPLNFPGRPSEAADLDGDGDIDLLSYDASAQTVYLDRAGPGGTFTANALVIAANLHPQARFIDVDGDGDLDVTVGTVAPGSTLYLIENTGGALQAAVPIATAATTGQGVHAADFDGDGLLDLLVGPAQDSLNSVLGNDLLLRRSGPGFAAFDAPHTYFGREVYGSADLDGDGDLDAMGNSPMFNWRYTGAAAGIIHQYGSGSAGSGGAVPVLGASGPVRAGSTSAALHLRRVLGNTLAILAVSGAPASIPNLPFPGMTALISPSALFPLFTVHVAGPSGVAGLGHADVPVNVNAGLVGFTFYHQAFVFDPGSASLFAASNGLEIHYGQ